jgi:hypothetical protein
MKGQSGLRDEPVYVFARGSTAAKPQEKIDWQQ